MEAKHERISSFPARVAPRSTRGTRFDDPCASNATARTFTKARTRTGAGGGAGGGVNNSSLAPGHPPGPARVA